MHLRSISMKGFKSFPSRTKLEFGPGVSVVVGRPLLGHHPVIHELSAPRQPLLEHRLVVNGVLERLVDLLQERLDHRRPGALEAEGEVRRADDGLADRGEHALGAQQELGRGEGKTKKAAEQEAALHALDLLDEQAAS